MSDLNRSITGLALNYSPPLLQLLPSLVLLSHNYVKFLFNDFLFQGKLDLNLNTLFAGAAFM
jgi:hypothetical protein